MDIDISQIQKDGILAPGHFSLIYRCYYHNKECVLKEYPHMKYSDMSKYIEILNAARHPFIIGFEGFLINKDSIGLVFEYCDLHSFLSFIPSCSDALRYKVLLDTSIALEYLHRHDIFHCDIQPTHIFLTSIDVKQQVNCKLGGFGRPRQLELEKLSPLQFQRTLVYRAPEVLKALQYSFYSDIFSFGILAYETFSRQLPYTDSAGKAPTEDLLKITQDVPLTRKDLLSDAIWELICGCCRYKPRDRWCISNIQKVLKGEFKMAFDISEMAPINHIELPYKIISVIGSYINELQNWTNLYSYEPIYQSRLDELTSPAIISKIGSKKNIMIFVQTAEGHLFGAFYTNSTHHHTRSQFGLINDNQPQHFIFSLVNPHNHPPVQMRKRKEYPSYLKLSHSSKSSCIISVPSFFMIYYEKPSYISTNVNVVYEDPTGHGFDLFCIGSDYSIPTSVTFNFRELFIVQWKKKDVKPSSSEMINKESFNTY